MTIAKEGNALLIGKDFVEAVTGPYRSHGSIQTREGKVFTFLSTVGCSDSSDALIRAAEKEGNRLLNVTTQSFNEWRERMADNTTTYSRPFFEPLMQA